MNTHRWIMWIATHLMCALSGGMLVYGVLWLSSDYERRAAETFVRFGTIVTALTEYRIAVGGYPSEVEKASRTGEAGGQQSRTYAFRQFIPDDVPIDSKGNVLDGWGREIKIDLMPIGGAGWLLELVSDGQNGVPEDGRGDDVVWLKLLP